MPGRGERCQDVLNLMQFILKVLESSRAEGLAVSLVNFSAAVFLKQLLGLLLHFLGHAARTLGPEVKQDQAALQHIWEGPGLNTLRKLSYSLIRLRKPFG